jgi:endo-1,4-beta-xylanase
MIPMKLKFISFTGQTWDPKRGQPHIFLADENEYPFDIPEVAGNQIVADIGERKSAALHLRWKIPSFGEVTLMTRQLAPSEQPYNLNVEIAGERIAKVESKTEEWRGKGFKPSAVFVEKLAKAKEILKYALGNEAEEVNARWADLSLSYSMPAGETLALEHAEWGLQKRSEADGFRSFLFGCNFYGYPDNGIQYEKHFEELFNSATLPFYWSAFETQPGQCGWDDIDNKIRWLDKRSLKKKGHPLFWAQFIPEWVEVDDHSSLKETIKQHIHTIVGRYKNVIEYWDVINEIQHLNLDAKLRYTNEEAIEFTRLCSEAVKETDPLAKRVVNCDDPFAEYLAWKPGGGFHPKAYFEELIRKHVDFDVIGIQLYQGAGWTYTRDLFEMSRYFDHYEKFNKEVHLTELGIPSREGVDPNDFSSNYGHGMIPWKASDAGFWHEPWCQKVQADWVEGFYKILMAKPFINGITWWDFSDYGTHFYPYSGLLDDKLEPKESYRRLVDLKKKYLCGR